MIKASENMQVMKQATEKDKGGFSVLCSAASRASKRESGPSNAKPPDASAIGPVLNH
jgi:hypothetical protein